MSKRFNRFSQESIKYIFFILFAMSLLSCTGMRRYSPFNPGRPSIEELRSFKTYALSFEPSPENRYYEFVPYRESAKRLFGYAGVALVSGEEAQKPDLPVVILRPVTRALYANYHVSSFQSGASSGMRLLYTGAEISGYMDIRTPSGKLEILYFSGKDPVATGTLENPATPAEAPYGMALKKPGGYYDAILTYLFNVYGKEVVFKALLDSDADIRRVALHISRKKGLKDSVPYLEKLLIEYDDYDNKYVMELLGYFDARSSAATLTDILNTKHTNSSSLVDLLAKWEYREALPVMIRRMPDSKQSGDYMLPYSLIAAFKLMKVRDAIPAVIRYIESNDQHYPAKSYDARDEAIDFLETISGRKLGKEVEPYKEWWQKEGRNAGNSSP